MPQTFYVGQNKYEIPENLVTGFLGDNPDAVKGLNYNIEGKNYLIPEDQIQEFLKQNPDAVENLPEVSLEETQKPEKVTYEDENLNDINQRINSNIDRMFSLPTEIKAEPESIDTSAELPEDSTFINKTELFRNNWNKTVDDFNDAFYTFIDNLISGRTSTEEAGEPVAEFFNRYRDDDEKVSTEEIPANIAEGVTKLLALPISLARDITENPGEFIRFLAVESPKMIGELMQAAGLDPILQTRIALGDQKAIEYKQEMVNKVNRYPVEFFMQPFIFKGIVKQATGVTIKPMAGISKKGEPTFKMRAVKETIPIIDKTAQLLGYLKSKKIYDKVEGIYYRKVKKGETGLVPLDEMIEPMIEQHIKANPKMSEAELARAFPEYFENSLEKRIIGEKPVKETVAGRKVVFEPPIEVPAPVEPVKPPVKAVKPVKVVTEPVKEVKPVEAKLEPIKAPVEILKNIVKERPPGEPTIIEAIGSKDAVYIGKTKAIDGKEADVYLYENKNMLSNWRFMVIGKNYASEVGWAGGLEILNEKLPTVDVLEDLIRLDRRFAKPAEPPVEVPEVKPVTAVAKEQSAKLNKQYNEMLQAQAAAQAYLLREDLPGGMIEIYERSFEKSTALLEDLELEAKTKGITLVKKPTETDAIIELKELFQEIDPEVVYEESLSELRTLKDNIEDALHPETPENAMLQIQAAGQELAGLKAEDIKIAGQNYQEVRDGTLVDVVKLHQGADMGTVIEERAETWYGTQEQLSPDWDKTITEERRIYHERTGEKDDPTQSNVEWFSDKAKDNAIGAEPVGKVGAALQRIFTKFRQYAQALQKSAKKFARHVREGKVPSKLKTFLERAIEEPIKTPEQVAKALMKDVEGKPSPTKVTYSLKKTDKIILPSKSKNRGATFITGDPANINLKGEYEDFGIRYPRTYKGWALNSTPAVTKLLNDIKSGYNVVGITSLVDAKGALMDNDAYLNAIYRKMEEKVGVREAKKILEKEGDIFKAAIKLKVNLSEVARETAVPDFSQIARKVVAVATIKDFRTGDRRLYPHPIYDIEVNFETYRELPQPIDLDTFVEALPKSDSRVANPFFAAKQYWLSVLNQESPQVQMLSDYAATGDASIFGFKPEAYQFASPQIKQIGLEEAMKGIKTKKLVEFHMSVAQMEVEAGIKSITTAALGQYMGEAEPSIMTTINEPVEFALLEYLNAMKGLIGSQKEVNEFDINPEGTDNIYKISIDKNLEELPDIIKALARNGIVGSTMPVSGINVDLIVVDNGGVLVNSVNEIGEIFNAETELQKGYSRAIGDPDSRQKAERTFLKIIRDYEGRTGRYSKVLRDRLPVHRPRFNRNLLPKRPRYQLKKLTPDERRLREEKKQKLKEITDRGVEEEKAKIPKLIIERRADIATKTFDVNSYLYEIEKLTTEQERELIPFLLEKSKDIPSELGRKDLSEMIKDKATVERLQPVVDSFRQRYKELWDIQAKLNPELAKKDIKDYVTHIWDIPKNKRADVVSWFTTYNKFQEKRYIETLIEGITMYDLKPKYTDMNDIFRIYSSIVNHSVVNKKFVDRVRKLNVGGKPLITTPTHAPSGWEEIHHSAMKNPFTHQYYKVHPDLVKPLKVVLSSRIETGRVMSAYEAINGVLKQTQLSLSLFHHLALSETAMPIVSYKDVPKMLGVVLKTPWKGFIKMESDVWQKQEIARDFLEHNGQLGVSADIPVKQITGYLKSLEVKTKGLPIAGKASELISGFYDRWNFALWDYLHDHFKLYAYESFVSRYKGSEIDIYKSEMAQLVNDTFGGQNWDTLMVSPKTKQALTWFLLSPDWTLSTIRQALAPTGIGSATKTPEGRKMRAKAGRRFWVKAMLYYGFLMNMLNTMSRKKDIEDNPQYYPDREEYGFWDYTMFGNTIGQQTRLFTGRNEDGTESYLRWGKQFREFPELFFDETGFNFPQATFKRLGAKFAPFAQIPFQIFTGVSPSGFENYDVKGKRKLDWVVGVGKTLLRTPLPFSTQAALRKDKKWNPTNLFAPSGKGMTKRRAADLMEISISRGDDEYLRQVMIGCYRNNLDGYTIFKHTLSRMVSDFRSEETRLLKTAEEFEEQAKKATGSSKIYYYQQAADIRVSVEQATHSRARIIQALDELKIAKVKHPDVFGE